MIPSKIARHFMPLDMNSSVINNNRYKTVLILSKNIIQLCLNKNTI